MNSFAKIQAATLAARARTGDRNIAANVSKGIFEIVKAVPQSGRGVYAVTVLKSGLTAEQAVKALDSL